MNKFLAATAVVFAFSVASPAMAATQAECDAQWAKLDAKKAGYVMNADAKQHVDMMSKAGRKTAAADRISSKEFVDSCLANVFGKSQ